ncbi:hypothetical protein H4K35_03840 [Myroides sp. NP-2]|uniref:hypothetical protein n=1 Tax=Myroides sp. NP-2 TaxID=2759945 RepID=UPI0015F8D8EA|nr:hypothetical protein [Myroides sp. NP-2]MBB1149272.1 hypothetical protein [Myroides sp. NP-2]
MRKIVLSFSLLALVLTGTVSCSSDDNSSEQHRKKTLELTILKGNTVAVNEEVSFTVAVGGTTVEGSLIYVDGKQVANPYIFTTAGTYKVVAKKEGYNDSNEITVQVKQAAASIRKTWIPVHVNVVMPAGDPIAMAYPKNPDCDDDTLVFNDGEQVSFNFHDESCAVSTTGSHWSFNAATNLLTFTLFDQEMKVNVTTLTEDKLVIKAKGDQFAALIPILVPDLAAGLPPALLALIEVELEFNAQ